MVEKRPYSPDNAADNGSKRPRSTNASPAPSGGPNLDIQKKIEEAKKRAEAIKARMTQGAAASTISPAEAARKKLEALKERLAASKAGQTAQQQQQQQQQQPTAAPVQPPAFSPLQDSDDGMSRARGGLGIGLHPALMSDAAQDSRGRGKQAMAPKFATTMANRRTEGHSDRLGKERKELDLLGPNVEELKKNPYYDPNLGIQAGGGRRHSRNLIFNQKGKYIQQANALRRQAMLEQMKKKIALSTKRAGLDEDSDKAFLIPEPPEIEWWDEGLIGASEYDFRPEVLKVDTEDSIITSYVQHPVLIQPPQDKLAPAPKAMYLTPKELKKKRRQERMANHQEQQAKIRLGLEPPPPPKIKKSNVMRVLGEEAVKDPTAVEARVNREIAERAEKHETTNHERKLTQEQRHAKLAAQQEADAAKGIHMCVFKIDNLSYGKHRYQIDINAKQNALTGLTILNPKLNLVIVEGGEHSIRNYRKLLLNRIKWTENAPPPASAHDGDENEDANNATSSHAAKNKEAESQAQWLQVFDEKGDLKDLSLNKCTLIWEGEERQRTFRKWGNRVCETDTEAKDALSRAKLESFWALAKSTP